MDKVMFTYTTMSIIQTLSMLIVAVFTVLNYKMYQKIHQRDEDYKRRTSDLSQGIIIATLMSGPGWIGGLREAIPEFKKLYKGETKIFD